MKSIVLKIQFLCAILLLGIASACGGTSATTAPPSATATDTPPPPVATDTPSAGVEILEATFTHGVDEDGRPIDSVTSFLPDEKVYLAFTLKGRPKGTLTAHFYRGDKELGDASLDLSDLNSGVVFSIGENTYVNFWMDASPDHPLIISDDYRIEVSYDAQSIGSYAFRVVPPPDAIPTRIYEVTLARGSDENYNPIEPTTTFAPDEEVYLVVRGDAGRYTRLKTEWYVNGQLDETATKSITIVEDTEDTGGFFSHLPEGGWPVGEHQVVLIVNDEEFGRYDFTVEEAALVPFEDPEGIFSILIPADLDRFEKNKTGGYNYLFYASDGSGTIYVYFYAFDKPFSDEEWQGFAEDYDVVGMEPFGEDVIELDRQLGGPGEHFIYLEVESKENDIHALVWVQEAEGAMTVMTLSAPIDVWPDREADFSTALNNFTWWPDAVHAALGGQQE